MCAGELHSNRCLIVIMKPGQPSDGPMGISVALTPSTHTVTVSKSMITNASFRTKKLPGEWHRFDAKHMQIVHLTRRQSENSYLVVFIVITMTNSS